MELDTIKELAVNMPPFGVATPEQESAVLELCHAAMWLAIGKQTQLSRSGFSVVFVPEHRQHRADLSGEPVRALHQVQSAGIDVQSVNESQLAAYRSWREQLDLDRQVGWARVRISRKFSEPYRGSTGSCGVFVRVSLIDGLGNCVDAERIESLSNWEPNAKNQIGGLGAAVSSPNYAAIERVISRWQQEHPEYSKSTVVDNNSKESVCSYSAPN